MNKFYAGIDVGSASVKVMIVAAPETRDMPMHILGTSTVPSRGMRHGYSVDIKETALAIREAIQRASAAAKVQVKSARVAIGGIGLEEYRSTGETTLTASGGMVSARDIDHVLRDSEKRLSAKLANRVILHTIPLEFRVDGAKVMSNHAIGIRGAKLSADTLVITILEQHRDDIIEAIEAAGVEVDTGDVMAAPLAASFVMLTKQQRMAGVVLANIGAETTSIAIFEDDTLVSIKVFPVGSSDITHSIALAFQVPLQEAEQVKRGAVIGGDIPEKKMQVLIAARLKDVFTLINAHLKSIGRAKLLPAGIVITGGGSGVVSTSDIARAVLKLPAQAGHVSYLPRSANVDASQTVAYGLCRWGYLEDTVGPGTTWAEVAKRAWERTLQNAKSLLP